MRFILLSLLALRALSCMAGNVLSNPDFEDSNMSVWTRTVISGIRPWSRGAASPHSGDWYVFEVDEASIRQDFTPVPGNLFSEFTFWADRPPTAHLSLQLHYSQGPASGQIDIDSMTSSGWGRVDVLPLVDLTRSLTGIEITKLGAGTTRLDDFRAMTPDPAEFRNVGLAGNIVMLSITNIPSGSTNCLQISSDLVTNGWITVAEFVAAGTGTNLTYTLTNGWAAGFVRLLKL